jgi:DNA-binding NtrC family response regulator
MMNVEKAQVVLVIDDEEAVRDAVTDILEFVGMVVMSAVDGISGIELFRAHQEEIDLVLLDLSMPGLNGADTFDELRKINPAAKVILSSGYDEAEATRYFVGQGVVSFLQKPYNMPVLVKKVRESLGDEK